MSTTRSLELVLSLRQLESHGVWARLYSSHRAFLDGVKTLLLDGKPCPAAAISERISRSGKVHFGVSLDDEASIEYGHVTNHDLSLVIISGCVSDEHDATRWLLPFFDDAFRQARLYDRDYEHWQNAEDPLEYRAQGRSYDHLPMKPNGLPPPLDQMVIDTSRNPGRRVLRQGFVEGVGSPIWLGASFWSITGKDPAQVCAQPWLRCEAAAPGVICLRPTDMPFTTAEGKDRDLQESLRSVLYV